MSKAQALSPTTSQATRHPAPPAAAEAYELGAFQIHCSERVLWHGARRLHLTGKPFELLVLLVQNAGHTLDKRALLNALWPDVAVDENNIAVAVRTVRRVLQEREPGSVFIETVPRRGYRWVQPARAIPAPLVVGTRSGVPTVSLAGSAVGPPDEPFVGREPELQALETRWAGARSGAGGSVFISGELGMGKSALVRRFEALARASTPELLVLRGQSEQLLGSAEPYLPWLDALRAALSGPARNVWLQALQQHAPAWCTYLPTIFEPLARPLEHAGNAPAWQRPSLGPRELVEALHSVAQACPLLVVLEDLHWADASSVDVLRLLATRVNLQRALILVTYRPVEVAMYPEAAASAPRADLALANLPRAPHPLAVLLSDLEGRQRRDELRLEGLEEQHLQQYLEERFGAQPNTIALSHALWQQTEGLPLFATRLVQSLVDRARLRPNSGGGWSLEPFSGEPDPGIGSLRAVIRGHFERLSPADRHTLDVASVEGPEFGVALVARLLRQDPVAVDERLERLANVHRLVERAGEEPLQGGAFDARYRFSHVLFQNFLYRELARYQRVRLHRRAARLLLARQLPARRADAESRWPARLALHFERGRDFRRAVRFFIAAGDAAERAHAKLEALACYARAGALLDELPPDERRGFEVLLHHGQGWASVGLARFGAAEHHFGELTRLAVEIEGVAERLDGASRERTLRYFQRPWSDPVMERPARIFPRAECREFGVELRAEALRCQCFVAHATGRTEALAERARELLQHSEVHPSLPRRAEALGWLGAHALAEGQFSDASRVLKEALALARSCEHERGLCLALRQRAALHLMQAEFGLAHAAYQEFLLRVPDARSAADALLGLAEAHAKRAQLQAAFAAYRRSEQLMQRVWAGFPAVHAWLLSELGQHDEARDCAAAALSSLEGLDDRPLLARLHADLAHAACRCGDPVLARHHLERAEGLISVEQRRCPAHINPVRAARCELLYQTGQLSSSHEEAATWCTEARERGDMEAVSAARRWLARCAAAQGARERAREHIEAAIEVAQTHPVPLSDWRSYAILHQLTRSTAEAETAQIALAEARSGLAALAEQLDAGVQRERLNLEAQRMGVGFAQAHAE
jgi:predicted ATPase/DNA-binding winged helix-turn-helix (wHTH) protein